MPDKVKSNVVLVKEFFDIPTKEMMKEWRELSETDKEQLADGIRSESLTY